MKVAIVGSSHLKKVDKMRAKRLLTAMFENFKYDTQIISGGAAGIDSMVKHFATLKAMDIIEYKPATQDWREFRRRNIKIAEECDELFCIATQLYDVKCYHHMSPQPHQKTAGCWTMKQAMRLGKPCQLVVLEKENEV